MENTKIKNWLVNTDKVTFTIFTIIAAFCTYSCMYAFRKPFAVASFTGIDLWGIDYKTLLIISQVLGYMLSKFLGIKIVSEMKQNKRAVTILILIAMAELSLFLFSITPMPYNLIFLFFNGLPLGMVWGLVFSYLEGRRLTEVLGAGLSISFIVSSGFVKSVGKIVMNDFGISEYSMPYVTGLIFAIPLVIFVWMLDQVPPPSKEDEELRTVRVPMNYSERVNFFKTFAFGISILTLIYMGLTAFRDLRDNYAVEIWTELGYADQPMIFTYTELPIAFFVLIIMGSLMLIKNNMKALLVNHFIILIGILLVGISTQAFLSGIISPTIWMVIIGLGLYMGYVPFNCILFDRFIATYKTASNAGFLIYIADSFGYLASVGLLIYKNFGESELSWYDFFIKSAFTLTIIGSVLTVVSIIYFRRKQILSAVKANKVQEPLPNKI